MIKNTLIGTRIEIVDAQNKNLLGLSGKVIDETKNILMLETQKGIKKLIKSQITLKLGANIIKGDHIIRRPEEIR